MDSSGVLIQQTTTMASTTDHQENDEDRTNYNDEIQIFTMKWKEKQTEEKM